MALECTELAAAYSKERIQFGRPIAMYQAVKHHCANMCVATELTTSAVWDAAMAAEIGEDQLSYAAAIAATLAAPAADLCANLNTQVHGGIAITWEHDAHLYMRRATTLLHFIDSEQAAEDLVDLSRKGVVRTKDIKLPPEADKIRAEVKAFADSIKDLSAEEQRTKLIETGYVMPHWPKPYGRDASAIEQLVIEQEFSAAEIKRPQYGITAWNILTIIQHGNQDQMDRWVLPGARPRGHLVPALQRARRRLRRRRREDQGHPRRRRLARQRPEGVDLRRPLLRHGLRHRAHQPRRPEARRHHDDGDRHARRRRGGPPAEDDHGQLGVQRGVLQRRVRARRRRRRSGRRRLDRRPRHARQRERVDRRRGRRQHVDGRRRCSCRCSTPTPSASRAAPPASVATSPSSTRIGLLNLRAANRAVSGGGPGPEGAMTKLVLSEVGHESAAIMTELNGEDSVFMDGPGGMSNMMVLMHRGMSIAGGTSEIKRNQIGERILGLPRDPLIK